MEYEILKMPLYSRQEAITWGCFYFGKKLINRLDFIGY